MLISSAPARRAALAVALGAALLLAGCATSTARPAPSSAPVTPTTAAQGGMPYGGMPSGGMPGMHGGPPGSEEGGSDQDDADGGPTGMPHRNSPRTSSAAPHTGSIAGEGMSAAQAQALQAAVDAGHQPWRLDPSSVALAFVGSRLGWAGPRVDLGDPHTAEVTNSEGSIVSLQLAQPAREGSAGIWVVSSGVWIR